MVVRDQDDLCIHLSMILTDRVKNFGFIFSKVPIRFNKSEVSISVPRSSSRVCLTIAFTSSLVTYLLKQD